MTMSSTAPARANLPLRVSPPPRISSRPVTMANWVLSGKPAGTGCHCRAKSWNQMPTAPNKMAPSANGSALVFMELLQECIPRQRAVYASIPAAGRRIGPTRHRYGCRSGGAGLPHDDVDALGVRIEHDLRLAPLELAAHLHHL